jgi:Tol biopolymer transport system component
MAGIVRAQQPSPAALLLEAADQKATIEGDLAGAIRDYDSIVTTYGRTHRPAAAQALLKKADLLRKQGDAARAQATFDRVVREYADQSAVAAEARARQAAVAPGAAAEPRVLCDQCGSVGSVSRDGRWYVVSNIRTGGDVERREIATEAVLRLNAKTDALPVAQGGSQTYWPLLSPDSSQLAYAFVPTATGPQANDVARFAELRLMPNQPGATGRVVVTNPEILYPVPVGWRGSGAILIKALKPDLTWQLMWVDVATGSTTPLKSLDWRVGELARDVSLSPDGRYVAYSALVTNPPGPNSLYEPTDRRIYLLAADGSSESALTEGTGVFNYPVWTPDGSHVVYTSDVSGTVDLWARPIRDGRAAGEPKLLRKAIGDAISLGLTDAGVYHYFQGRTGVHRASIVPLERPATNNAVSVERFVGRGPRWSPDGRLMAVRRPRVGVANVSDLVVRDLADGTERVYRHEGLLAQSPVWLTGGRSLLVLSRDAGQPWWYRLDLDVEKGRFTPLVNFQQVRDRFEGFLVPTSKVLSPDGRTLYFSAAGPTPGGRDIGRIDRIAALDLLTGECRTVLMVPGTDDTLPFVTQGMAIAVSPDGRTLAIAHMGKTPGQTRLVRIDLDGNNVRELVPPFNNDGLTNTLTWSRDGRWIYFVERGGPGGDRVMRVSASGGTPAFTGVEVRDISDFDVSPDGARLAYGTSNPEGAGMLHVTLDLTALLQVRP